MVEHCSKLSKSDYLQWFDNIHVAAQNFCLDVWDTLYYMAPNRVISLKGYDPAKLERVIRTFVFFLQTTPGDKGYHIDIEQARITRDKIVT